MGSFMEVFVGSWVPFIVLIAVYIFFMRQMKNGGDGNPMLAILQEQKKTNELLEKLINKK